MRFVRTDRDIVSSANHPFEGFSLPLSRRHIRAMALLVLALSLVSVTPAADAPGDLLRRQFESAKSSLAAGNLDLAESSFRQAIALGLRQLGNLSISPTAASAACRKRSRRL
jgi:hypothetical protein